MKTGKKSKYYTTFFICLAFAILSLLIIAPFIRTQHLLIMSDWSFHANRVEQIYQNLRQKSIFTFIASSTFHSTGVGSFLFYPTLFFYPWAMFRFFLSPVNSFYAWYALVTFATMMVAYFSMMEWKHDKFQSFLFALIYSLSGYRVYLGTAVFGELVAGIFIPVAFLGIYEVLFRNTKRWPVLAIGISLMVYSHVLSVFLSAQIMLVIFAYALLRKRVKTNQIIGLAKAVGLALLLSAARITPFITDFIGKGVSSAYSGIGLLNTLSDVFYNSLGNQAGYASVGIILIMMVLLGTIFIRINSVEGVSYIFGCALLLISTNFFPWKLFNIPIIDAIQLPWRYLAFACFFLAIPASFLLAGFINKTQSSSALSSFKYIFVILISLVSVWGATAWQKSILLNPQKALNKSAASMKVIPNPTVVDNKNYSQIFHYTVLFGETDYYPKKALEYNKHSSKYSNQNKYSNQKSIIMHEALVNNSPIRINPIPKPNGLKYLINSKKNGTVDLPMVYYSSLSASVNNRGEKIEQSSRGTVQVDIKRGKNVVLVQYRPKTVYVLSVILSALTALIICVTYVALGFRH